ncbi:MAG: NAD(P)H-dependent oxidoreductase [Octadecabacter sp.]|nr:NAD(P)H-dependent oxidoreductase [Octadecabacter sp.]
MAHTVLNIQASARHDGSVTRQLSDKVIAEIGADKIITRDLSKGLPLLDGAWLGANFTPVSDRTDAKRKTLALSDSLIDEIEAADTLVIGSPVYNFSVPAALKAWIDQICRVGVTFKYSPDGPVGLMSGKRAIIVIASGGTPVGSDIDYASGYLKHIMGFIGIHDVTIIAADALGKDAEAKLAAANVDIESLSFKGAV